MTALDVARTIARSEGAVLAYQDQPHLTIMRDLALGPQAALLVAQLGAPVTVPGAPTSVAAIANDATHVAVSFSPPVSDGGAGIDSYEVTSAPGGFVATGAKSPITVEAAYVQNTGYVFTVKAINEIGKSVASAPSNQTLPFPP